MFFNRESTKRILNDRRNGNIKVFDIFKYGKNTFKLFCDVKKSENTMGVNNNFCVSKLSDTGWVIVADYADLGLDKVSISEDEIITKEKIETAFHAFKEFAKTL